MIAYGKWFSFGNVKNANCGHLRIFGLVILWQPWPNLFFRWKSREQIESHLSKCRKIGLI